MRKRVERWCVLTNRYTWAKVNKWVIKGNAWAEVQLAAVRIPCDVPCSCGKVSLVSLWSIVGRTSFFDACLQDIDSIMC